MGPSRKPHAAPGPEPPPRTKVVVRNLPPGLSRSAFLDAVASAGFAGKDKVRWFDYVQGKAKPKLLVPSVAYADLVDAQTVRAFADAFHGRAFAVEAPSSPAGDPNDDGGNVAVASEAGESTKEEANETALPPAPEREPESRTCEAARASRDAIVEYAPNQRVPRGARLMEKTTARRRDNMEGTVERDAEYVRFLADLEAGPKLAPSAETLLDRAEAARRAEKRANGGVSPSRPSALLEFLAANSSAWRVERGKGAKGAKGAKEAKGASRRKTPLSADPDRADNARKDKSSAKALKMKRAETRGVAGAGATPSSGARAEKEGRDENENERRETKARRAVAPKVLARPNREPEAEPKIPPPPPEKKKERKKEKPARGRVVFLHSESVSVSSSASREKKGKATEPPPASRRSAGAPGAKVAREKSKPNGPGPGRGCEREKRPPAMPRP